MLSAFLRREEGTFKILAKNITASKNTPIKKILDLNHLQLGVNQHFIRLQELYRMNFTSDIFHNVWLWGVMDLCMQGKNTNSNQNFGGFSYDRHFELSYFA